MKLQKKVYTERSEKRKDFWIGVGIFLGLNILMILIGTLISVGIAAITAGGGSLATGLDSFLLYNPLSGLILTCISALPLLINFLVMIYFGLTRSQIALGMVAALAVLLLLGIFIGCIASAICFVTYPGVGF